MKEHWPRHSPMVELDAAAVDRLVLPLFPGNTIVSIETIKGGLTNTNLKIRLSNRPRALLLRIYQRGVAPAQKEMAVYKLVSDHVPVPHFIHFGIESPVTRHPYAIIEWIEGVELQHAIPTLSANEQIDIAQSIGRMLAAIHAFSFATFGFLDAALKIERPIDLDGNALLAYLHDCLVDGPGRDRIGLDLSDALLAFAAREGRILADWLQRPCLVHGDFNASNILIRRNDGGCGWDIAGIIDWEYALSASPAFDFGNLLRPPFEHNAEFEIALARGYAEAGGELPRDWRRIARLADMFSFADILSRPATNAIVVNDAKAVIRRLVAP